MSRSTVTRLLLGAALASTAALAACEEPQPQTRPIETPMVEDAVPAAEASAAPVAAEAPESEPATPVETLPTDQRTSEQTVQPESDTLFY
jgi:hypothetical protein